MAQATSGKLSLPFMIAAFLAVGGFLYWLSIVSEPTEFAVAEEEVDAAQPVTLEAFAASPGGFLDQRIALDGVEVSRLVGIHAFWFVLPDEEETEYLVRLDRDLVEGENLRVLPEDRLHLTGQVFTMTDSIVETWDASEIFADEEEREEVGAVQTFFHADGAEPTGAAGDAEPVEEPTENDDGRNG